MARTTAKKKGRRFWRWVGGILFLFFVIGLGAIGFTGKYVYEAWKDLPTVNESSGTDWAMSSIIYDRNGNELYTLHGGEMRTPVKLRDVPQHVLDAFVAVEDFRFRQHRGIDVVRLAGVIVHNAKVLVSGGSLQGASTITQQLARNAFLTQDQTIARKVKEMLLAIQLENHLSKDEILERYLNEIWFGRSYYGVGTAATVYFGKEVHALGVAEGAMLAGMIKDPARYDPYRNLDEARERMNIVLGQMAKYGYLSEAEVLAARDQKINLPGLPSGAGKIENFTGDDFVDYVMEILLDPKAAARYGITPLTDRQLFSGGLQIQTTFDPALQALIDDAITTVMDENNEKNPYRKHMGMPPEKPDEWVQAAVVLMDPASGDVKALMGGRGPRRGMRQLNRATDTLRQPGSTIKPLVAYIPAVEELGYGPGTVIDDSAYQILGGGLWPDNYDFKYGGLTPLRQGLARSINAMAVRLLSQVGPQKALSYAERLGVHSLVRAPAQPNDENLSTALGGISHGVTLLEMTNAFGTIANLGLRVDPVVITEIRDHGGKVIYRTTRPREQAINPSTAYLVIQMMRDVLRYGTAAGTSGGFGRWPVAGKTGTTENNVDAWFIGFTKDIVVGVWNGYDNRDKPRRLAYTGAGVPLQVWDHIMKQLVTEEPPDWPRPKDLVAVEICAKTGLLPSPYCPPDQIRTELFPRGRAPREWDDEYWTMAAVVEQDEQWRLWQPGCPGLPENRVFLTRPDYVRLPEPEKQTAPRYAPSDIALAPPTEYCTGPVFTEPAPEPADAAPEEQEYSLSDLFPTAPIRGDED